MQSESPTRLLRLSAIIAPLVLLAGCLGDGEGPQTIAGTPQPVETGLLVDSAVDGAAWESSDGESGLTGLGEFQFRAFEPVTFSVGGIVLGTVAGASILTPVELTGSNNPTDQAAINMMVFLQSIDADADHSNGITITETTRNLAQGLTLDFNDPDFTTQVEAVVAAITVPPNEVVEESVALLNFYQTYSDLGGTDTFSFSFPGFPPVGGGVSYELVFSDEFNEGDTPNPEHWSIETGYGPNNDGNGNNEWQLYTDSPDNIRVEEGNLVIQARCPEEPCGVRDGTITSGKVNTLDKFEFRYGTVYARIKPPVGDGAWPAFWSLGANFPQVGWPRSGEIDFMEMHNAFSDAMTTHFTMHWCDETIALPGRVCFPADQGWRFITANETFSESLGDEFHVFEADWNSDRIVGRIDGIQYFELDIDALTMEEFLREFYLILNVAMGGTLGSDNQPPNGNETWPQTMLVDYVRVFQQIGGEQDTIFIDFEDSPESYDFGPDGGFGGGASSVIDNPVAEGINTSAQVAQMLKFEAEPFGGSTLALSPAAEIGLGSTFTMEVWSPRVVDVLFKFEGPVEAEVSVTHGGTGWEELSFDFSSFTGTVEGFTFIFDLGIIGDAGGDPDNWTFYYDDITQIIDDGTPGLQQIDLPITFDDRSVDYTVTDFGDPVAAMTMLVGDPDDALNTVASTVKPVGAPVWAGTTMSTEDGLVSPIPFSETATTIGVRVYSPDAGIPVRLKADDVVGGEIGVETEALTTVAGEWETLVFDFANEVEGPPLDLNVSYTALSIFFNFGTDGDTAGEKTYLWDDVVFGVLPPDDVAPTLTFVNMVSDNADPALAAAGDTVTVTLTADESIVTPVVTIGGVAADSVTGAGVSWQASRTLTDTDAEGAVAFSIEYADFAGNAGLPVSMTTDGSGVVLDVTAPTVAIEGAPAMFTTLSPIGLTFQFSEPVDGFELGDIQTVNGAATNFAVIDGATYAADVTPTGTGDLTLGVAAGAATDPAGNLSEMASDITVVSGLDEDAPLLSVIGIASDGPDPAFARVGDVVTIAMTATEDIVAPTVTIAGSPSDPPTGGGTDWQASRTLLDTDPEGLVTFVINFEDVNGVAGPESTVTTDGSTVTFDITAPTVSIDGVPATIEFLDPIPVTFQFDEDVAGFDVGGIDVTNGTADAFVTVDAATYTADVTPDGLGDLTVAVAADAATDPAGNGNEGASVDATLDLQTVWREIWSDEFDGAVLDTANWTVRTDEDCPVPCDGVQFYRTDRVSVGGGVLRIEARDDVARGGPTYTSGLVDTRGKLEFRYGRIEIQATLPGTTGVAPTLWMLPATDAYGPWPQSGQVDLTRDPGDGGSMLEHTLRYGLPVPEDTLTDGMSASVGNTSVEYALEWEAGEIRWFVNDVHVVTETQDNWYAYGEDVDGVYTLGTGAAPFGEDFYLLISLPVPDLGASGFPHSLEIEAVRVFECANPVDPAAGTGCSTGTGVPPTVRPGAPFVPEPLPVYADGPAVISFNEDGTVNPIGTGNTNTLQPGSTDIAPGMVVSANFDDGGNTVWRVNVTSGGSGGGEVFMASGALSASPPLDDGFDLTGGGTAGELLFSLRVNSATAGTPQLMAGLQSPDGNGGKVLLTLPPEGEWQNYSVKIADLLDPDNAAGTGLDLTNVVNLFVIEAVGADIEFDVDDISVKVACRDNGGCQATARLATAEEEYAQTFEAPLDPADPDALSSDDWLVGANVFAPDGTTFLYNYFTFPAPNGGPAFSAVAVGEGGDSQGLNQLTVYNDYNNLDHGNGTGNRIEANVFRERPVVEDDLGRTFTFSFDAKRGNINDPADSGCTGTPNPPCNSTAKAFIKTLDPGAGFSTTTIDEVDMTSVSTSWSRSELMVTIPDDMNFVGQVLQFGFLNVASDFEPSGVFYDNLQVTK